VTNDAGQSTTSSQTVVVDDPPTATLAPSRLVSTPGSPVTFSSLAASPDTGGSIDYYSWNFGDPGSADNAATGSSAAHTYSSPGTYRVTITVTDDLGVSIQKIVQVTVDAPPAAAFTASANVVTAGSWVSFDASGSSDSVGTITGYRWNFGDPSSAGNTATSRAANHLYGNPGIYPVSLTVTNDAGQTATRSWSVTVNPVPTVTPPSAPTPAPVSPPAPSPAPVRTPLTASLSAAKKQKLASVLPHGLVASLAVSQGTTATFQVTLPASRSPLAQGQTNASPIVLLRTRAQNLGAGTHVIKLKLSRGAAGQLPGTGPIVLTVRVNLTTAGGGTVTRTVKITLTR
jgi:PKD repeat protein